MSDTVMSTATATAPEADYVPREAREAREPREMREAREPRETREAREPRETREAREPRETREVREPRETRESREPRESRDREPRESRYAPRDSEYAPRASSELGWSAEQLATEARTLTESVMKAMGFEATVTATAEEDRADVSIAVTDQEDLLTGPKGEVRQALQHLLTLMINRGQNARYHIQLEVNEFWRKREVELETVARSMADEAVTNGTEVVTEYLNAQERRIVHMTLKEDRRVKTYALGTGLIKRVAIAPADFEGGPRDEE